MFQKHWILAWLALVALGASISASAEQPVRPPLRLGSAVMDSVPVMQKRLLPLAAYLSTELGRPVTLNLASNMSGAIHDFVADEVDFAFLTPFAYVEAHSQAKARLVVKSISNGESVLKLVIIARADGPIRTVADLAGKKFAFGDKAALMQRAVVVGAGMPLERLGNYVFLDHFNNIVRGVLNGDFDAGIVPDDAALLWKDKGLRAVYRSPNLPPFNIAASQKLDAATFSALQAALLRLNMSNPEHKKVLLSLSDSYSGFARASDAEYEPVRELIKPFKK